MKKQYKTNVELTIPPPGPTWNFALAHTNANKTTAKSTIPSFSSRGAPARARNTSNTNDIHAEHEKHFRTNAIPALFTLQAGPPGACQSHLEPSGSLLYGMRLLHWHTTNAKKTPAASTNQAFGSTWAPASVHNMINKQGIHANHENHKNITKNHTHT